MQNSDDSLVERQEVPSSIPVPTPFQKSAVKGTLLILVVVFVAGLVYGARNHDSDYSLVYGSTKVESAVACGLLAVLMLSAVAFITAFAVVVAYLIFLW